MSFLLYQRSDPRNEDWLPLKSQQIRLRNLVQIIGVNLGASENTELFFTLHVTPLSAPFFTSEKVKQKAGQRVVIWKEIEPENAYYSGVKLSAKGCTVRIWSKSTGEENCSALMTWGVYFEGLYRLGSQNDWSSDMFENNVILFRAPFGVFTAESCIKPRPTSLTRYLVISKTLAECRPSYKCKLLASLHRRQRAIIEEVALSIDLKSECEILAFSESGSSASVPGNERRIILSSRGRRIRPGSKKVQLELKKQIEAVKFKVLSLAEEKGRAEGRLQRIKKERLGVDEMNRELLQRIDNLNNERRRLQQFKLTLIEKRHQLSQLRSDVFLRKKQLISELSLIYPLTLIDSVKRYSINGVQLPESDYLGYEGGGQASVALGYTAHLVSMLCFFLGIPLRYPIRHFGSRSRILDHITANIPEREREFPLYYKGKPDIFSIYGAYLLNKNIAQIRWYCGLVTQDLKATLPNLASLIHNRLAIRGWDQNFDDDSLEMAQELTEETDKILFRSENSISLDQGLDDLRVAEDKIQSNLSSSVSNMEYDHAANNSAAVGDVYRGRAQEKFLTGWKKVGQTQAEEVDPSWLVNSMDADSDCGRRLSTTVNRSCHSDIESSVTSSNGDQPRRRRIGQVALPEQIMNPPIISKDKISCNVNSRSTVREAENSNSSSQFVIHDDDSLQAKQLRLLDRKISMYFGDRAASSSKRTIVRRTRSFDRLPLDAPSFESFAGFHSHSHAKPLLPPTAHESGADGESFGKNIPEQTVANVNVVISEPYFRCSTTTEFSDVETDNCDYHINPPVESLSTKSENHDAVLKEDNKINNSVENSEQSVVAEAVAGKELLQTEIPTKEESEYLQFEEEGQDSKKISDDSDQREESIPGILGSEEVQSVEDRSLDDESLWNRTEALMSSYQSFNLLRKSAIDPK